MIPQELNRICPVPFRVLLAVLIMFSSGTLPAANQQTNWRFFTPVDGLGEAWSSYISLGPSGRVWVSHGGIDEMSWLDGWPGENGKYVNTMPNPGADLKIFESHCGQLWSLHEYGIQLYQDGAWKKYFVKNIENPYLPDNILRHLTPFSPGRENEAYYLEPGRLMRFEVTHETNELVKTARQGGIGEFREMIPAKEKGCWITGARGVAYFSLPDSAGAGDWNAYDLTGFGLKDFGSPEEGMGGELLVTGVRANGGGGKHLLRLHNGRWSVLPDCRGGIEKAWPGGEEDYWILKTNNELVNVRRGIERVEERIGILAAEIRDVAVDTDGAFWLTTSHGVARYCPSLWRTPAAIADQKVWVHGILEDAGGRIWFSCSDRIIRYDNSKWTVFKLPDNMSSQPFGTQSFCELADGRLVIGTLPYRNFLLTFDPRTERYGRIPYHNDAHKNLESQTNIGLITQYGDGKLLVETRLNQEPSGFRVETFDGEKFETIFDQWDNLLFGNPRFFLKASNGDLWVAGAMGNRAMIIDGGGNFEYLDMPPMFNDNGFFAICEIEPGKFWIGGRNYIMQYYENNWTVVRSGLSSVRSIIKTADNTVWVVSGTGVHRYHDGSWVSNDQEDGLPNDGVFAVLQDSRGRTWAGTIEGLSLYAPLADVFPPQTLISESQNLRESPPGGEVRLVYSALDKWNYTDSKRLLFSYRLDGGDWSEFKTGEMAVFNRLQFGHHMFEVRAMDVNFNSDVEPAAYEFTVLLPWYRETGFQLILGAGTTIIIFLLGLAIHRHIMLEKLVVERTNDLQVANVQLKENLHELIDTQGNLELEQKKLEIALGHENLLAGIASMLNSTVDLPFALQEVINTMTGRLKLHCACLTSCDNSANRFFDRLVSQNGSPGPVRKISGCGFCAQKSEFLLEMLKSRDILVIPDWREADEEIKPLLAECGIGSLCLLPVAKSGSIMGMACFCSKDSYDWPAADRELLGTAMNMISNAWERHSEFQARLQAEKKQYEALQIADKASRLASIGVIAAGITHEINQPLNDIKVTADSVMMWDKHNRGILPDEFSSWLQSISGSVNRITGIIKQMRTYWVTPGQTGNEPVNLGESVVSAVSLVGHQLDAHGVALKIVHQDEKLMVRGNKVNLEQIVLNLVVNAMHALDELERKEKFVTVTVGRQDGQAYIHVADNGPGLQEDHVGKLFDPFYTTKKSIDGMGLGLAIVKRFAEGFGGRVFAANNPDGGACFTVQIPLIDVA